MASTPMSPSKTPKPTVPVKATGPAAMDSGVRCCGESCTC